MISYHIILSRIERYDMISLSSPQGEDEILAVCGDAGNQAAYRKVIRGHPEGLLWMAIFETRQASREHRITKARGSYFMATVKDLASRWATAQSTPSP